MHPAKNTMRPNFGTRLFSRRENHILFLCALWFILLAACNPTPTIAPIASPTINSNDEWAIYRPALTTAAQNDLAQLDRPTRYTLTLTYDPATLTLTGKQAVVYFNRQATPLNDIYFRLFANYPGSGGNITVTQVTVNDAPVEAKHEVQNTALRVPLASPLAPNSSVRLQLDFSVTIPRGGGHHYEDFIAGEYVTTMPTVYPLIPAIDAKGWNIDLPPPYGDLVYADASLYVVTLTVPSHLLVIASGSTIDVRDNGNGTTTWRIAGAPMRDFSINLTDKLQKASQVIGETTINSYFEPSDADAGQKALHITVDAFKTFEKRFGAYPYRELDVVQTPTTAGGIEYPGLIVIGRRLYSDQSQQDFFEFATAHEVAHQWWYAVVGNDQINAPWVDEALAQYSTLIYYEDVRNSGSFILRNVFQGQYQRARNEGRDAVVNQPVSAFSEANYSAIVYGKGPLFFDAIRKKMGDEKFFAFLRAYYERYRYKIAVPDDVLKTAEESCACNLSVEYQTWITSPSK